MSWSRIGGQVCHGKHHKLRNRRGTDPESGLAVRILSLGYEANSSPCFVGLIDLLCRPYLRSKKQRKRVQNRAAHEQLEFLRFPALFGVAFPFILVGYLIRVASLTKKTGPAPPGLSFVSIRMFCTTHRYGDVWPDLHHAVTPEDAIE